MENPMQFSLSPKYRMLPTLFIFAALALMSSVCSILLFGEFAIPLASSALSLVFILERGRKRIFSIAIPVLIVALSIALFGIYSYVALEIIVLALILSLAFLKTSKSESAFWLTLASVVFFVVSMALAVYADTKQLSLDAFLDFYLGLYEKLESIFVDGFAEISILFGISSENADPALAASVIRSFASIVPSIIIILSFAISGISLKLQSLMVKAVADEQTRTAVGKWRFALASPIYYAFWAVLLLKFIFDFSSNVGVLGVTVANIYNVLLYVFAYLGFGVVVRMLTKLFKSRRLAVLATLGAMLLFSGLAIEIIAYFGAAFIFHEKRKTDGN